MTFLLLSIAIFAAIAIFLKYGETDDTHPNHYKHIDDDYCDPEVSDITDKHAHEEYCDVDIDDDSDSCESNDD